MTTNSIFEGKVESEPDSATSPSRVTNYAKIKMAKQQSDISLNTEEFNKYDAIDYNAVIVPNEVQRDEIEAIICCLAKTYKR